MAGDKQLKFQLIVDEQSARRAKQVVSELTSEVKKLVETLGRVNLGGIAGPQQGGGLGGVGLTAKTGVSPQNARAQHSPLGGMGQQLTQSLTNQAAVFRAISAGSKDALRAMSQELQANLSKQQRILESQSASVDRLAKQYLKLKEAAHGAVTGYASEEAQNIFGKMGRALAHRDSSARRVESLMSSQAQVAAALGGGPSGAGAPPSGPPSSGGGAGGGGHPPGGGAGGSRVSPGDLALLTAAIGRAIGQGLGAAGGVVQQHKTMEAVNLASTAAGTRRLLRGMMQGDVRDFYFLNHMRGPDGRVMRDYALDKFGGTKASTAMFAGEALGHVGEVIGGLATLVPVARAAKVGGAMATRTAAAVSPSHRRPAGAAPTYGDVMGMGGNVFSAGMHAYHAASQIFHGGPQAAEMATIWQGIDALQAANPLFGAAMDTLQSEKHLRASASRKLMGRHMAFRGIGAGYGYGFGESVGMAEGMQRLVGMQGMTDSYRSSTSIERDVARWMNRDTIHGIAIAQESLDSQTARAYEHRLRQLRTKPFRDKANADAWGVPEGVFDSTDDFGAFAPVIAGAIARVDTATASRNISSHMKAVADSIPQRVWTGRGLFQSSLQLAAAGINHGAGAGALTSIFGALGGLNGSQGGVTGAERSMRLIEEAVKRGTTAGFTDPRAQEELVVAMGQAASGARISSTEGLATLSQFLTLGAPNNVSVAEAQARRGVLASTDALFSNNPFFQGVSVASAKGILGPGNRNNAKLMALADANASQLLTGGQWADDFGISKSQRLTAFRDRISSMVSAYSSYDPELQKALQDAGGDLSKVDPRLIRRTLRRTKSFGSDQLANAAGDMFTELTGLGDLESVSDRRLKRYGDALAMASISLEERTKAKLMGESMAEGLKQVFKELTPEAMIEKIRQAEKAGEQYKVETGKMFVVEIIRPWNEQAPTPTNGRGKGN